MSLDPVAVGQPHVAAHNDERDAINALIAGGGGSAVSSVFGRTGDVTGTKADVGLGAVDNTADIDKDVATALALAVAHTINGVVFDGTANIIVPDLKVVEVSGAFGARPITAANVPVEYVSKTGALPTGGGTESGGTYAVNGVDLLILAT